ncbi:MAG: hypothetical protein ACI38V_10010 [Bacteroides sp.]
MNLNSAAKIIISVETRYPLGVSFCSFDVNQASFAPPAAAMVHIGNPILHFAPFIFHDAAIRYGGVNHVDEVEKSPKAGLHTGQNGGIQAIKSRKQME